MDASSLARLGAEFGSVSSCVGGATAGRASTTATGWPRSFSPLSESNSARALARFLPVDTDPSQAKASPARKVPTSTRAGHLHVRKTESRRRGGGEASERESEEKAAMTGKFSFGRSASPIIQSRPGSFANCLARLGPSGDCCVLADNKHHEAWRGPVLDGRWR